MLGYEMKKEKESDCSNNFNHVYIVNMYFIIWHTYISQLLAFAPLTQCLSLFNLLAPYGSSGSD